MEYDTKILAVHEIDEPREAMRSDIDRNEIFELAHDIQKNGLINPITVRPRGDRYEVVAGHRRLLAHRYGGMVHIKCIVRDLTDDEAFAIMTSENLAREDVNYLDEATHTARIYEKSGGDLAQTCSVLNRSRDWVATRLLIAEMPEELKTALKEEKIKLGVALALHEITDEIDRKGCLQMAITQGASVVVAQYWLAQWRAGLFGHAREVSLPDENGIGVPRKVVMLRCAVDGAEYPASDFVSLLVAKKNVGYVDAIRDHLLTEGVKKMNEPPLEAAPPESVLN